MPISKSRPLPVMTQVMFLVFAFYPPLPLVPHPLHQIAQGQDKRLLGGLIEPDVVPDVVSFIGLGMLGRSANGFEIERYAGAPSGGHFSGDFAGVGVVERHIAPQKFGRFMLLIPLHQVAQQDRTPMEIPSKSVFLHILERFEIVRRVIWRAFHDPRYEDGLRCLGMLYLKHLVSSSLRYSMDMRSSARTCSAGCG
ncbi:hypothetical protein BU23DRAFT_148765 [Bimuria novae-zelandiae CBS 107.79]|uniref:Uncharacterized protein n=1 Tax=Bimuria novae-zelandiae CBS 107.79 TaxID=1447943 RepID=A0A6A5W190_9PLEO|nr:hypothetical protein BU23DRAFT_148765 [Bimuria novae-zelandiae CBS 107.79]